jgi:hypothetical protein
VRHNANVLKKPLCDHKHGKRFVARDEAEDTAVSCFWRIERFEGCIVALSISTSSALQPTFYDAYAS